jgi:hypothetical protein
MAMQPRQLVSRWRHPANLSEAWEKARLVIDPSLRELTRILGVIHAAVEYPPAESQGRVAPPLSGANTSCTVTTPTNISGASVTYTPEVDGTAVIYANWCIQCTLFGGIGQYFRGNLSVNGVVQGQQAIESASAVNERRMTSQNYLVSMVSGTSYTFQLTGQTDNVATTYDVIRLHTGFTWLTVPKLYKVP